MHMRLTAFSTLIHTALLSSALACGPPSGDQGSARSPQSDFKVALLTPGPVSDHSWNAGAYQGLQRIRDSLGAQISNIETKTPADFEENFRQYGVQGYDLVFGHGFEFQDPASRVGPSFPHTQYVITSGNRTGANVSPIVFGFEEPSFVAGVLAASLSRRGVVGMIGGTELPPVKSSFLAFAAGARSVNPDVKVLTSYIGNWEDASAGKEQALAQIRQGADLIFQNADAAGLGIFQAARESKNVYVFGTNSDQNGVAPDVIVGSVVIDLPRAFLEVAREVKARNFRAHVIRLGERSGVVRLVLNPALASIIPPAVHARLESTDADLQSGSIKPPRIDFVDSAATN